MIASDLNNPEFAGAINNPDARLWVQFYRKPVENAFKSEQEQRPVFDEVDFVKIMVPGDKLSIIDTFVRDEHKRRFPMQWAAYQNRTGDQMKISGTPISEWPRISAAQAEELRALKFYTVESIASASDAQLQHIGMIAGQSAFTFRDDAKRFLSLADAAAKQREADEKLKAVNEEFAKKEADLKAQMEEMRKQMAALLAATTEKLEGEKKRGRKPHTETEPTAETQEG
jgi:hypothetical protein